MNNSRRKMVKEVVKSLNSMQSILESISKILIDEKLKDKDLSEYFETSIEVLNECASDIADIIDEEQEAYDNLPEGIQMSERGEAMEDIIDELYDKQSDIENASDDLQDLFDTYTEEREEFDANELKGLADTLNEIGEDILQIIA